MTDEWIKRVNEADDEAEMAYRDARRSDYTLGEIPAVVDCLLAIAAELRAARIARRPRYRVEVKP